MSFEFGIGDLVAVSTLANKVRRRFVDAPEQFRALADEVKSLSNVLRDLEDIDLLPEKDLSDRQQADLQDHLRGCNNVLEELDQRLYKYWGSDEVGKSSKLRERSRRLWERLDCQAWKVTLYLEQENLIKFDHDIRHRDPIDLTLLRNRLTSNVSLLNAFISALTAHRVQTMQATVDQLTLHQKNRRFENVLEWLSSSDFPTQQNQFFRSCQEGTGSWLLDSREFKTWLDGSMENTLFCPGIPGAGKTMLTAIVVHYLQNHFRDLEDIAIAYVYCNYKRQAEQSTEYLLTSIFKQLLWGKSSLPRNVDELYEQHAGRHSQPSLDEVLAVIGTLIQTLSRTIIVIDAIDEVTSADGNRSRFLKAVSTLRAHKTVSVFATSRDIPDITAHFVGSLKLEISATDEDVRRYLEYHLSDLPACVHPNTKLKEAIVTEVTESVQGMFLLAQLHLGSLSDKMTPKRMYRALRDLPKGSKALDLAYKNALERIEAQKEGLEELAKMVLAWIVATLRPLEMIELRHALAVEDDVTSLDEENLPEAADILSVCAGLVVHDEDSGIVRLVHYTTQEYFERTLEDWAPHAHETIVKTCLTYLSLDFVPGIHLNDDGSPVVPGNLGARFWLFCSGNPFLEYAANNWGGHYEKCWHESCGTMMQLMGRIDIDINCESGRYPDLPLSMAARRGQGAVTALLLQDSRIRPACAQLPDTTPALFFAAIFGHENIMIQLLNTPEIQHDTFTPEVLGSAAFHGIETIVAFLLKRDDFDANWISPRPGFKCLTPLMSAAKAGQVEVVKLLLASEKVNVNKEMNASQLTALSHAATQGCDEIIRLLLEKSGIKIQNIDLSLAASNGKEICLRLLLDKKPGLLNGKADQGRTALMNAAHYGQAAAVNILLSYPEIDINLKDNDCNTAIEHAYIRGETTIVGILLAESGRILPDGFADEESLLLATEINRNEAARLGKLPQTQEETIETDVEKC